MRSVVVEMVCWRWWGDGVGVRVYVDGCFLLRDGGDLGYGCGMGRYRGIGGV